MTQDELDIRALADRYSDALNRRDAAGMAACYTDDAVWECGEPINVRIEGKAALNAYNTQILDLVDVLVQITTSPVVTVEGDAATLRSTCHEIGRWRDGSRGLDHYAFYHSRLRRGEDGWRFTWRRFEVLFTSSAVPVGAAFPPSS